MPSLGSSSGAGLFPFLLTLLYETMEEPSCPTMTQEKYDQHSVQGVGRTYFLVRLQPEGETKAELVSLAGAFLLARDKSHLSLWFS